MHTVKHFFHIYAFFLGYAYNVVSPQNPRCVYARPTICIPAQQGTAFEYLASRELHFQQGTAFERLASRELHFQQGTAFTLLVSRELHLKPKSAGSQFSQGAFPWEN
jgi:hypothetical protein